MRCRSRPSGCFGLWRFEDLHDPLRSRQVLVLIITHSSAIGSVEKAVMTVCRKLLRSEKHKHPIIQLAQVFQNEGTYDSCLNAQAGGGSNLQPLPPVVSLFKFL